MNSKSTWVWLIIACALSGLIVLSRKVAQKPTLGPEPILGDFKAQTATSIRVGQIRAERTNGGWGLVNPDTLVIYPAYTDAITNLLYILDTLVPAIHISGTEMRQNPNAETDFGLATPQFVITLYNRDMRRQIDIGALTPSGDQVYVRVVGSDGISVVSADLFQVIPRIPEHWRDRAIVNLQTLPYDRVIVSNPTSSFELQRSSSNSLWMMSAPLTARADNQRINVLLRALDELRAARFVTDSTNTDLQQFGLQPPELQIAFAEGTNRIARLELGKSADTNGSQIFLRRADMNSVVTVPKKPLMPWYEPREKFRDHHLVGFTQRVDEIEVRGTNAFTLVRQADNAWKLKGEELPIDTGLVNGFIRAANEIEIQQFKDAITVPDLQRFGLEKPMRQIIFRAAGETNPVLGDLFFGATDGSVYVRRADEESVYAIAPADYYDHLSFTSWQFRERRIWNFAATNLSRVTIQQDGRTRQIIHLGTHKWMLPAGSQGVVDDLALEETAQRFGELSAGFWTERGAKDLARYGITNSYSLTFELGDRQKREIQFGTIEYPTYAAVELDGEIWVFEFPLDLYHNLVLRQLRIPANVQK
jgi:hypothetical protein